MIETLEYLKDTKTVLLRTYKRDGTAVPTPVSIAFEGDRAFFRSYDKAWKTKRLRNDPRVEVAPSTLRGKVTGETVAAQAALLADTDADTAARALAHRHPVLQGVLVPAAHRLLGYETMHYELTAR
jgi:PPOX class probable F420-dependent enzyme